MSMIEAVEGTLGANVAFHYDIFADVLYLRRLDELDTLEVGQDDAEGLVILHAQDDLRVIGVTVISFWKRFGHGEPSERRVAELAVLIEAQSSPWQARLLAA